MRAPEPRKVMPDPHLEERAFRKRFLEQFRDPAFGRFSAELEKIAAVAWDAYENGRKAPVTRKAGPEFADPDYDLSVDWIAARQAVREAQRRHEDLNGPLRILLINGSSRSEHTCPGEMSKSYRLIEIARAELASAETEILDLSRLASEYGRNIHPCKACFSTAAALCHWPCSCYPNHSLGQTSDWMAEIYERWTAAHGVIILTPVYWYQSPSPLKLMMDRLVCADGGNPDPTSTHGKKPEEAKALEMKGWDYPKHLAGRAFGLVVHGDVAGIEGTRRGLSDWLDWMGLIDAGSQARLDRYIGYYEPYATSHDALDADKAMLAEVGNAARAVARAVKELRAGTLSQPDKDLPQPRPK